MTARNINAAGIKGGRRKFEYYRDQGTEKKLSPGHDNGPCAAGD